MHSVWNTPIITPACCLRSANVKLFICICVCIYICVCVCICTCIFHPLSQLHAARSQPMRRLKMGEISTMLPSWYSFLQFVYFQASFLQFVVGIKTISISGVLILWFYGNLCNKEKIIQLVAHVIQQSIELSILEACSACLSCHLHSSGQSGTLPRCLPGKILHVKACCNLVLIKVSSY